jgi:ribosomal protein S27AE
MNTPRPHLIQHWTALLKRSFYRLLDEWYATKQESTRFTTLACPQCGAPAARPDDEFCTKCGVQMNDWPPTIVLSIPRKSTAHHTDVERNTDPFGVIQTTGPLRLYPGKSPAEIKALILKNNPPPDTQQMKAIDLKNRIKGVTPRLTRRLLPIEGESN